MATKKSKNNKKKTVGSRLRPAAKSKTLKKSVRPRRDRALTTAQKIIERCKALHPNTKTDCKNFLNAVAAEFFGEGFAGQADDIVLHLRDTKNGWKTTRKRTEAIAQAKAGMFVIAGATSKEMSTPQDRHDHGHVAIVVDLPPEMPNTPMAFAGSKDSESLRIAGRKISLTFRATMVHSEQLDYFYKKPTGP